MRLNEVEWILCPSCVAEFQTWLGLKKAQPAEPRSKGFPFDKAAPVFPGKSPLP